MMAAASAPLPWERLGQATEELPDCISDEGVPKPLPKRD
jgi:hypothetical protein